MAKYDDDDLMNSMDDWDDDDLLLLDTEAGELDSPSGSKSGSSGKNSSGSGDGSNKKGKRSKDDGSSGKKGRGGLVGLIILIVILIVLIIVIVAFLLALKSANGDFTELFGSSEEAEEEVIETEAEETESAEETEEAEESEETTEEEDTEAETAESETAETEETTETEEETVEVETEETTIDLSGLSLTQLIGDDYTPDLVYVNYYGVHMQEGDLQVDSAMVTNLEEFIAAAREMGYGTILSSCYYESTDDTSVDVLEHATGLAVDIVDTDQQIKNNFATDDAYAEERAWLAENCSTYGFILRFPEGKEDITGVEYIPYHFVYVGTTIAQQMSENDWCLEEYLAQ